MALYPFENIKTGEIRDIFFKMNDVKIYNGEDGLEVGLWERRYTVPQAAIDTKIDCMSSRDFVEKTGRKQGTFGSLLDASKEASLKRVEKMGYDPLKQKAIEKRKGKSRNDSSQVVKMKDIKIEI